MYMTAVIPKTVHRLGIAVCLKNGKYLGLTSYTIKNIHKKKKGTINSDEIMSTGQPY